jgi:hypothetical protein
LKINPKITKASVTYRPLPWNMTIDAIAANKISIEGVQITV